MWYITVDTFSAQNRDFKKETFKVLQHETRGGGALNQGKYFRFVQ